MARITLFRHGKAEMPSIAKTDFDRSLSSRGRLNAATMGNFIKDQAMLPDCVLISPAQRTRETFEIAATNWPSIPCHFCNSIYEGTASGLLLLIAERAADCKNVLIVGHNPGLVVLLNHMVGTHHTDRNLSYFPTSCVADVGFDVSRLGDMNAEEGALLSMIRVRDLNERKESL
jgi:phosphohistidine phosphatase